MGEATDPPAAGEVASAFIAEELGAERERKGSLETRGFAVIRSSGTLVTLLFGLAALVTKSSDFVLSDSAQWLLAGAGLLFVLAGALGIACNSPALYYQVDAASLAVFVTPEVWTEHGTDASRELTAARLAELADARDRNEQKAKLLAVAMALQVAAVLVTAAATTVILVES